MTDNFNPETGEVIEAEEEVFVSSLEQFKERLAREKEVNLYDDDPLTLAYLMFDFWLEDLETLIDKRDEQFDKFLKNACLVFGKEIEKKFIDLKQNHVMDDVVKSAVSIENINKALSKGSVEIQEVLEAEITKINQAIETLKTLRKSIVMLAIPNLVVALALIVLIIITFLK